MAVIGKFDYVSLISNSSKADWDILYLILLIRVYVILCYEKTYDEVIIHDSQVFLVALCI